MKNTANMRSHVLEFNVSARDDSYLKYRMFR